MLLSVLFRLVATCATWWQRSRIACWDGFPSLRSQSTNYLGPTSDGCDLGDCRHEHRQRTRGDTRRLDAKFPIKSIKPLWSTMLDEVPAGRSRPRPAGLGAEGASSGSFCLEVRSLQPAPCTIVGKEECHIGLLKRSRFPMTNPT